MRLWSSKYLILSFVGAANLTFLAYHLQLHRLKLFVRVPATLLLFVFLKNWISSKAMNRVYYPILPVYNRLKEQQRAPTSLKVTLDPHFIDYYKRKTP